MKAKRIVWILLVALTALCALTLASCGDDDDDDDDDNDASGDDDAATGPFSVSFSGTGFDAHNGQVFMVMLMNETEESVLDMQTIALTDGTFSVSWDDVLESDYEYHIHYFADFNSNGMCDEPPTDHVWLEVIDPPTQDLVIEVEHNTNFTDDPDCAEFNEMM